MTDKKFTDEEIIKAFQTCLEPDSDCKDCPLYCDYPLCGWRKYILDLINRQKEEIEKLKSKNKILSINADNAFQEGLNERRKLFEPEIKSEAYKEFAERLTSIGKQDGAYGLVSVFEIAKLLKEMVGKEE